jgi:hypothetical protein
MQRRLRRVELVRREMDVPTTDLGAVAFAGHIAPRVVVDRPRADIVRAPAPIYRS